MIRGDEVNVDLRKAPGLGILLGKSLSGMDSSAKSSAAKADGLHGYSFNFHQHRIRRQRQQPHGNCCPILSTLSRLRFFGGRRRQTPPISCFADVCLFDQIRLPVRVELGRETDAPFCPLPEGPPLPHRNAPVPRRRSSVFDRWNADCEWIPC